LMIKDMDLFLLESQTNQPLALPGIRARIVLT
jgi:hypothetical protein